MEDVFQIIALAYDIKISWVVKRIITDAYLSLTPLKDARVV
jgi:hypothetical protein